MACRAAARSPASSWIRARLRRAALCGCALPIASATSMACRQYPAPWSQTQGRRALPPGRTRCRASGSGSRSGGRWPAPARTGRWPGRSGRTGRSRSARLPRLMASPCLVAGLAVDGQRLLVHFDGPGDLAEVASSSGRGRPGRWPPRAGSRSRGRWPAPARRPRGPWGSGRGGSSSGRAAQGDGLTVPVAGLAGDGQRLLV